MHIVLYNIDGELSMKVDGSPVSFKDLADLANVLSKAYDAGVKKEGFIWDNQFKK